MKTVKTPSAKWVALFLTSLLFLAVAQAMAETGADNADPLLIDLNAAISLAMEKNTNFAVTRNEEEKAKSFKTEAIGVALPDLTLSATYTHFGNVPKATFGDQELQLQPDDDMTFNLNVHQWIYSGSVGAGLRGAKHLVAAAVARTAAVKNDTIAIVTNGHLAALFARELVLVQKESVRQLRFHVKDSKEREAVGLNTSYDTLRFETRLAQAIPALIEAKNGFEKAKSALMDILGVDPLRRVKVVGHLAYNLYPVTHEEAIKKALQTRSELTAADENLKVAGEYVLAARGETMPKVNAFGNYNYTSSPGDLSGEEKWRDEWNAGVRVEMNLFDGKERSSRLKRKILERENARLQKERVERMITLETKTAYNEYERAGEFVVSQKKNVAYAKETYRIAKERLAAGMTTQLELLDNQLTLTRAKGDYSRSLYEFMTAKSNLLRAMGVSQIEVEGK